MLHSSLVTRHVFPLYALRFTYYNRAMNPDSSVLVAVMNSQRDFTLAREQHWYRIPQKTAPKFFPPDFVAFYFTKPFGGEAFCVRYYSQVRGDELLKRSDHIPDQ